MFAMNVCCDAGGKRAPKRAPERDSK
eukprot:COSAG01_NODE_69951_length_260_cov_0.534161_2_plen_25_part_01